MKEVCIVNKDIKSCLYEIIPYIISKYSFFSKERDVICVCFHPYEDIFTVYPKNRYIGLTDWFLYNFNYQVSGYLTIHDVLVIIIGNKSLPYLKIKRKTKRMHIDNHPPPFDGVYLYWTYAINKEGGKCILVNKDDSPKEDPFY